MIQWRETYKIGVEEVDKQHEELVVKLNDFLDACIKQKGKDQIIETLTFLKDYTVDHFQTEEKLMLSMKYAEYDEHKKEHDDFIKDVVELESNIKQNGITTLTALKLNRTLVDWLLTHISKSDLKIGEFIRSKA